MLHPVPTLKETPSQTAGPYVHIGMTPNFAEIKGVYAQDPGVTILTPDTVGERIVITGRVIDGAGAHHLGRDPGWDIFVREPPGRVFGEQQLADFTRRVGQRGRHRMPAIEDGRTAGAAALALPPIRTAAPASIPALVGAAPKSRLTITFAHGWLVSWVPNNGNFRPQGGKTIFLGPVG